MFSDSGSVRAGGKMFGSYAIEWSQLLGCWHIAADQIALSVRC
jgi:hypothetical protein